MAIVVVGAEKGGVGKTCVAVNLASMAVASGTEVMLMDTDPTGSTNTWHRIRKRRGDAAEIFLTKAADEASETILRLSEKFELVVVDVGANAGNKLFNYSLLADAVLVPVGPDQFEVESCISVFERFRAMDHRHIRRSIPAKAVLTRMPPHVNNVDEVAVREHLASYGIPMFESTIKNRAAWRGVGRLGLGLHEMRGRDRDAKAIAEFTVFFNEFVEVTAKERA